jgi:hypothetical protein
VPAARVMELAREVAADGPDAILLWTTNLPDAACR